MVYTNGIYICIYICKDVGFLCSFISCIAMHGPVTVWEKVKLYCKKGTQDSYIFAYILLVFIIV